jgi:hypothetical protein
VATTTYPFYVPGDGWVIDNLTGGRYGTYTSQEEAQKKYNQINGLSAAPPAPTPLKALTAPTNGVPMSADDEARINAGLQAIGNMSDKQFDELKRRWDLQFGLSVAGTTGEYNGQPTQAAKQFAMSLPLSEAALTGVYQGQPTMQAQQQQFNQGLGALQLAASLKGPRDALAQQAVLHGLNEMGLSNAVDAIAGRKELAGFQAPQAKVEPLTLGSLAEDISGTGSGGTAAAEQPKVSWAGAPTPAPDYSAQSRQAALNVGATPEQANAYAAAHPGGGAETDARNWLPANTDYVDRNAIYTTALSGRGPSSPRGDWVSPEMAAEYARTHNQFDGADFDAWYDANKGRFETSESARYNTGARSAAGQRIQQNMPFTAQPLAPPPAPTPAPAVQQFSAPAVTGTDSAGQQAVNGGPVKVATATKQDYMQALPTPNKIVARNWLDLDPDTQQFLLGTYEDKGYSANDVLDAVKKTLPGFQAPRAGRIAA